MTLRQVHKSPKLLAMFLNRTYPPPSKTFTAQEWAEKLWKDYVKELRSTEHRQTYSQFLNECLRSIGVPTKGTLVERLNKAIQLHPDIYGLPICCTCGEPATHQVKHFNQTVRTVCDFHNKGFFIIRKLEQKHGQPV